MQFLTIFLQNSCKRSVFTKATQVRFEPSQTGSNLFGFIGFFRFFFFHGMVELQLKVRFFLVQSGLSLVFCLFFFLKKIYLQITPILLQCRLPVYNQGRPFPAITTTTIDDQQPHPCTVTYSTCHCSLHTLGLYMCVDTKKIFFLSVCIFFGAIYSGSQNCPNVLLFWTKVHGVR